MKMREYIIQEALDDFKNDIMGKIMSLCNYNDYNKINLLTIGDVIDTVFEKHIERHSNTEITEVVHGKWVWKDFNGDGFETLCCSECLGTEGARFTAQYCVECGAKMINTK